MDSNASYTLTSPTGTFVDTRTTFSGNGVWASDPISGWTTDLLADDYGIWDWDYTIGNSALTHNYTNIYFANFAAAAPPPTSNPPANVFRTYLPSDLDTAPLKPFLWQSLDVPAGETPNPPQVGQTTTVRVTLTFSNPAPFPVAFSAPSRLVTANVPGAGAVYGGIDAVSQGSVTSQPSIGGTGNIVWNPGTVGAGATAFLQYFVDVTPTVAAQRIPVTGTPALNGTTAVYLDETANAAQARATYTFGPLCELAITESGPILYVELDELGVRPSDDGSQLEVFWTTANEVDNAGFRVFRARRVPTTTTGWAVDAEVTTAFIPAAASGHGGADYSFVDPQPLADLDEQRGYYLMDIDLFGRQTLHGPVIHGTRQSAGVAGWSSYD